MSMISADRIPELIQLFANSIRIQAIVTANPQEYPIDSELMKGQQATAAEIDGILNSQINQVIEQFQSGLISSEEFIQIMREPVAILDAGHELAIKEAQ